jgi:hypothetical protein
MQVDAERAAGAIEVLAGLAQRARADDLLVYCWWSL